MYTDIYMYTYLYVNKYDWIAHASMPGYIACVLDGDFPGKISPELQNSICQYETFELATLVN